MYGPHHNLSRVYSGGSYDIANDCSRQCKNLSQCKISIICSFFLFKYLMNKHVLMAVIVLTFFKVASKLFDYCRVVEGNIQYWLHSLNVASLIICCHDVKIFNVFTLIVSTDIKNEQIIDILVFFGKSCDMLEIAGGGVYF